jgi:hypothetical protein
MGMTLLKMEVANPGRPDKIEDLEFLIDPALFIRCYLPRYCGA